MCISCYSLLFCSLLFCSLLFINILCVNTVNTWVDCGNEGEVFVTNTTKAWVAGEEFCQTLGGHLVSSPQVTACKAMIVGILGEEEVHISYTRLLDKLHFRDVGNNLKVSDNAVTINPRLDDCSSRYFGDGSQPQDAQCSSMRPIVCGRNTSKILTIGVVRKILIPYVRPFYKAMELYSIIKPVSVIKPWTYIRL